MTALEGRLTPALLACLAIPLAVVAQEPDLDEVLARAATWVARYERELGALVAEERYTQEASVIPAGSSRAHALPHARELLSEFVMLPVPGLDTRVGFRNVLKVNGRAVRDRERRFNALLLEKRYEDAIEFGRQLNEESSRYNIGPITRTVNVPTLALTVVRADHQARFAMRVDDDRERVDGRDAVVVAYEELDPPSLVEGPDGRSVFASGRAWIAPADGMVLRTELILRLQKGATPLARIIVRYARDERLDAWVPTQMEEEYLFRQNRVYCLARYSNYKRFETSGRVVP